MEAEDSLENNNFEDGDSIPEQTQVELGEQTDLDDIEMADSDQTVNEVEEKVANLREMVMAFLYVSLKPISIADLTRLTKAEEKDVQEVLEALVQEISELNFGLELKVVGENYQLRTKAELSKVLQRLITPKMKRLSKAAAETLAVIAYKQPVARAEIEAIRGVDALPTLKTLLDGKLVRIVGREDTPGSPALYGTTDFFLERFGLRDLSELPTIREVKELAEENSEESLDEEPDLEDLEENTAIEMPETENVTNH